MSKQHALRAVGREPGGSSAARRLRATGQVPGVVYGKRDVAYISVAELEFMRAIGRSLGSGMISLELDGKTETTIVKDVQWDPITDRPTHIDFLRVAMEDVVTVPVPVHLLNTPVGVSIGGGVLDHHMHEILVRVKVSDIPSELSLDVSALQIGDSLHVSDIALPAGAEHASSLESVVVSVLSPTVLKVTAEEEALAEEAAAAEEEEKEGAAASEEEEGAGDES